MKEGQKDSARTRGGGMQLLILALRQMRHWLEASLGYIVSARLV